MKTNQDQETLRRLNFFDSGAEQKLNISPDSIPTLVSSDIMKKWQEGDESPYYKLQKIAYPIVANRLIYEESFFESFVGKLNKRPIPGSKSGHNWMAGSKAPTDFILVGGKLESNGDGTGYVYFKNYIPKQGESGDNTVFIRENESDMVHYSLVTYPKEIIESDDEGTRIRIIESIKGERNDAVEYGTGAMEQITNSEISSDDNNAVGVKIISNEEIKTMDKAELLQRLNVLKANGEISLLEIAKAMNMEKLLKTDEDREAIAVIERINEAGITDVEAEIKRLQKEVSDGAIVKRDNELTEAFGPKKFKDGKENLIRDYADGKYNGDVTIEQIKEDPIYKTLLAQNADYTSEINKLAMVEPKRDNKEKPDEDSPKSVKY